jgi:hypothetical protein
MGGRETTRGIFLQAVVCLLETLQDNVWESLALEPDREAEKVDIAWYYPDRVKVTQVKSSRDQLNVPRARKWAKELESSWEATSYELVLIGPCSGELSKGQKYGNVEVPCPKPLDLRGLLEQSAHRLAVYLEWREKPAGRATTRENVVDSLVGKLLRYSANGTPVSRSSFEALLDEWVQDALGKEEEPSLEQLRILKEKINGLVEKTPYIRTLDIDHSEAVQWRGATRRYMRELDEVLPGDDFEKRRAEIPWHEPTKRATGGDYQRGCDIMKGLLADAVQKLQEKLDSMQ